MGRKLSLLLVLAVGLLLLAACGPGETPAPTEMTDATEAPTEEPSEVSLAIPFLEQWENSPHNDADAGAFTHWNEDDPAEIPTSCAKCHSTPGYQDFLGVDGSAFGSVEEAAPIGTTIQCVACHNSVAADMTSVVMPSGIELTGLGGEARCMQCHQGRASMFDVENAIEESGVDSDSVSEDLGFINIHYYAAAATKYGTLAKGGFEYEGQSYDANFMHVEGYETCIECHSSHTLEVRVDECTACHEGATSVEEIRNIRMPGSAVDYDGDGDTDEGIYYEIQGLQEILYSAIQRYATEVSGTGIVYSETAYPYFFIDSDGNGELSEDEAAFPNAYNAWTPRLLKAAYNYQVSKKDPGNYAHGGKYIIQLLNDSTEDLNSVLGEPVSLAEAHRIDAGHFAGSEDAFRHWDEDGEVPGSCSKCHSAQGLPLFLEEGVTITQPIANGFQCATCHNSVDEFTLYDVGGDVTFPSGLTAGFEENAPNLCINCHQGRQSTVQVNNAIEQAGVADNEVSEDLSFRNPHYFAAGATLFGDEVKGAYQYDGQTYLGRFEHVPNFNTCVACHSTHGLEVKVEACSGCHPSVTDAETLATIRGPDSTGVDYDGDGDAEEGIAGEIATMQSLLYEAFQAYALETVGTGIVYDAHAYPYFFIDTNENGEPDPDETNFGNQFNAWTPELLRAAYNYTWVTKDPGSYAHNGKYMMQVLYDSLQNIGADVSGMTRP
ncbi:MAG: cytochrome c3 family protein [Anaerolineales bacterium]